MSSERFDELACLGGVRQGNQGACRQLVEHEDRGSFGGAGFRGLSFSNKGTISGATTPPLAAGTV